MRMHANLIVIPWDQRFVGVDYMWRRSNKGYNNRRNTTANSKAVGVNGMVRWLRMRGNNRSVFQKETVELYIMYNRLLGKQGKPYRYIFIYKLTR